MPCFRLFFTILTPLPSSAIIPNPTRKTKTTHTMDDLRPKHKVAIPPSQPFHRSLKNSLKETFFPDDPLRQFKNKTQGRKLILGLQYVFPILEWGPRYSFDFLKADLISGITIASLAIPQGISYAKLANLPPILGLCMCVCIYMKILLWSSLYQTVRKNKHNMIY